MSASRTISLWSIAIALFTGDLRAAETDTALLSQPAVSANHVAFIYADDLWVAELDGKNPRRLTSDIGVEANLVLSRERRNIALCAEHDGSRHVAAILMDGWTPRLATCHCPL